MLLNYESLQQSTHLFEINPGARWYYEWESAATKAQRFTKHVMRVYVLERLSSQYAKSTLSVAAVASSSEFMVVSYRRATSEVRTDRRLLTMLVDSASTSSQAAAALLASSVDGDSDDGPPDAGPARLQYTQYAMVATGEKPTLIPSLRHLTSPTSLDCSPLRYATAATETQIQDHGDLMWQEKKLWESSHPETLMLTKHLAIIYHFLSNADATRFTHCLSQWSVIFADQWSSPQSPVQTQSHTASATTSNQRYHPYGSPDRTESSHRAPAGGSTNNTKVSWYFLMKLASSTSQTAPYRGHARGGATNGEELHAERMAQLVETCADVAGWLVFDVDNIRLFRRVFSEYAPTLLNKDALRGTFVKWVRLIYDLIGHFLASSSSTSRNNVHLASTQALVEDIIAIVFKSDALEALRPQVLGILSSTSMHGLAGFVAQVRSHFVSKSQQGSPRSPDESIRNNMALTRVLQGFTSPLHGRWHFDGAQSVVESLDHSGTHGISMGDILDWLRECSVVAIDVQDDDRLAIRSLWSVASGSTAGGDGEASGLDTMQLVADGRARVFSHFPSGLSSMLAIGDRRYGDYQASFVAPDALALELYAWSKSGESEGFYARESATPVWGSEGGGAMESQSTVIRWKVRLSMERFGGPTATPDAQILRVEALVERGALSASHDRSLEMNTLQRRLGAVDE